MQMARASKKDIELVIEFFNTLEAFFEDGVVPISDGEDREVNDEQFVEHLRKLWGERFGRARVDAAWRRVVFGCDVLIDNCCDPNLGHLEWKPEIKAAIKAYEASKTSGQVVQS